MKTPTLECPKCGRQVTQPPEPAGECPSCGVVFSKIHLPGRPGRPVPPPSGAYGVANRRLGVGPLLGGMAVLAALALSAVGWVESRGPELLAAPTVNTSPEPAPPAPSAGEAAKERLAALPPVEGADLTGEERRQGVAASAELAARTVPARATSQAAASSAGKRWVEPDSRWFEGAAGFDQGLLRARDKNQAVLVYFYADWCGYCRQLESELLNRAVVEEYTKYLVKIKVNPEAGASERNLAKTYGVTGYPSVFVHPAGLGQPKKIRGMTKKSGSWRPLSTEDYVENLATAAGELFGPS